MAKRKNYEAKFDKNSKVISVGFTDKPFLVILKGRTWRYNRKSNKSYRLGYICRWQRLWMR